MRVVTAVNGGARGGNVDAQLSLFLKQPQAITYRLRDPSELHAADGGAIVVYGTLCFFFVGKKNLNKTSSTLFSRNSK